MFRLRTTASVSLLVLIGATGASLWMSAWPRLHDEPIEAAVAARHDASDAVPAPAAPPRHVRHAPTRHTRPAPAPAPVQPPSPVYSPSPSYPMEALRKGHGGVVTLHVSVDADGNVTAVNVAHSSGDMALDRSARDTMRHWRFHAPDSGKPMSFDYPVRFRIETTARR